MEAGSLVDVSHVVEDGMTTYPGLPGPVIREHLSREASGAHYDEQAAFHIGSIELVANTGTYVDAPFHRFEDGKDLADLPLSSLADLPGLVVRVPEGRRAIGPDVLAGLHVEDHAVLFHTGWSRHWRTDAYFDGHPFLTEETCRALVERGTRLVGIDSLNIDDTADPRRPAHTELLRAEIPIVEHLTRLEAVPDHGFRFFAVPVKVRAFGTFPVRAFCRVASAVGRAKKIT